MCIRGLQILLHVFVRSTRDCLFHTGEHRTSLLDRSCSRILWVSSSHKGKGSPSQQTLCAGLCDLMSLYRKPRHFGEKRILVAAYLFGWALMSRWKFTRKTSKVCKRNAARVLQWEQILRWYHMEAAFAEEELPTLDFPLGPAVLLRAWVLEQGMDTVHSGWIRGAHFRMALVLWDGVGLFFIITLCEGKELRGISRPSFFSQETQ